MSKLLFSTALVLGLAASASANTVDWKIDGYFSENTGGAIVNHGNTFKWGVPWSTLSVTEYSGPEEYSANGHYDVHLLDLSWHNATSFTLPTQHLDLDIDLGWTSPDVGGGSETYELSITNTSDFSNCKWIWCDYTPQDDTITAFLLDGDLDFGGVPLPLGPNVRVESYEWILASGSDGGLSNGYWYNPEHGNSTLQLKAKISVVPLPAAGWMLLAGVGGLVAMKRRRKAEAAA